MDDLFRLGGDGRDRERRRPLVDVALAGHGAVGAWARPDRSLGSQVGERSQPIRCVFLSSPGDGDEVVGHYLKRRYPDWEVPPDLEREGWTAGVGGGGACPDVPAVPLPIPLTRGTSGELKLLSFAFRGRRISKAVFLPLARLLTDRDGGLWDNLPWETWTIDPDRKVNEQYKTKTGQKYLMGRRDAYNHMIGKDWYGRSISPGNVAARIKYGIEDMGDDDDEVGEGYSNDAAAASSLDLRILQVRAREAAGELAEAERKYAIVKAKFEEDEFTSDEVLIEHYGEIKAAVDGVDRCMRAQGAVRDALRESDDESPASRTRLEETVDEFLEDLVQRRYADADGDGGAGWGDAARRLVRGIRKQDLMKDLGIILDREATDKFKNPLVAFLDGVIERETRNAPPYRGAIGYAPQVDTKEEMFHKAVLPYRSPYDLLVEIIEEQLNARVVGAVLENSSLFPGTLVLEGAVVLQRRGNVRSVELGGEVVEVEDGEDDMGNAGVRMGETLVVECSGAEALGVSLACNLPLGAERKVWEETVTDVSLDSGGVEPLSETETESVMNAIPPVVPSPYGHNRVTVVKGGEALVGGHRWMGGEGDGGDDSVADAGPVRSVADYDALSIPVKARMVLSSNGFEGTLPRPRSLLRFSRELDAHVRERRERGREGLPDGGRGAPAIRTTLSPLDEALVPLLEDESVRQEILLRDARDRGDRLAIDSIQRTVDELDEKNGADRREEEKKDEGDGVSILKTLDKLSRMFEKEVEGKPEEKTEDQKKSSISKLDE